MSLFIIFSLAVGLSMDAFSLSMIYGTLNIKKNMQKLMSIMVGIFHFFMPIIGYKVGEIILNIIPIKPELLVGIIFMILSIQMIFSLRNQEVVKMLNNFLSVIFFAFTVSIDSFSIGIGFGALHNNILIPCIVFSITSCFFTYIGVYIGSKLSYKFGSITTLIGSIILFILSISYIM